MGLTQSGRRGLRCPGGGDCGVRFFFLPMTRRCRAAGAIRLTGSPPNVSRQVVLFALYAYVVWGGGRSRWTPISDDCGDPGRLLLLIDIILYLLLPCLASGLFRLVPCVPRAGSVVWAAPVPPGSAVLFLYIDMSVQPVRV